MARHLPRRGRALASITALAGLCLAGTAVVTGPAVSAEPTGDCGQAFPVSDLHEHDAVNGLTVSSGTDPEPFTGTVLGVLHDGIAPGVDMIMVRLTSDEIDRVGGIWEGMSGSPVYAEDGRLIGAVSYGLATTSPVAGVTPYADMQDYLPAQPTGVRLDRSHARVVARAAGVPTADATKFRQLPMPLGVTGVRSSLLGAPTKAHPWLPRSSYGAGSATADAAPAESIVAGGNLAASVSYGDITMAGVGTTTSVCDGHVVAFGHPLAYLGDTTEALHPADAIYVQEDLLAPFKVANIGAPVGTVTGDHLTGLTGEIGPLPETTSVSASAAYGSRSRDGESFVSVTDPDYLATVAFYQFSANHDRVLDETAIGQELMSWTVTGTDPAGKPFSLTVPNRYYTSWDLTEDIGYYVGDAVYSLASIRGVTLDSVTSDATDISPGQRPDRITSVERKSAGHWVKLNRKRGMTTRAGAVLRLRAVVTGADGTRRVPLTFRVPKGAHRRIAMLDVTGGDSLWSQPDLSSIAKAKRSLKSFVRNDQIRAQFGRMTDDDYYGDLEIDLRGSHRVRPAAFNITHTVGPLDSVVRGSIGVPVYIR
jgi:hypothetical protein